MRRLLVAVSVALAAVAATAEPASACSCALGDPRTALARADGAFIGVLLERRGGIVRSSADPVTLVFRVEERVKGSLGRTVEVETAASGASCGIEAQVGDRIGLFLERRGGKWTGSLCSQIVPARLREAARPLPAPDGSGPVTMLVGGTFGAMRTLALDRRGRTLAYGRGAGETQFLAACPGSRRAAEISWLRGGFVLAVRELRTLRLVRERRLRLPAATYPTALRCGDGAASSIVVFSTNLDLPQSARLLRVGLHRTSTLWRGTALYASFTGRHAYVNAGRRATALLRIDLRTRKATRVASLPAFTGALAPTPDGTRLAGVAYSAPLRRTSPPSRLVVVDRGRVRTVALGGSNVTGDVFWVEDGGLAFFPRGAVDAARVYDRSLRLRTSFGGWNARATALVGATAFGLDYEGRLLAARLPRGPVRIVRSLPSPVTHALVAIPN